MMTQSWLTIIPDAAMWSWESQAHQYPVTMPKPGIYELRVGEDMKLPADTDPPLSKEDTVVACFLTYLHEQGTEGPGYLVQISNRYNITNELERVGNVNTWTHPDFRRKGFASRALDALQEVWGPIPWGQQRYSATGWKFYCHYVLGVSHDER